MTDTPNDRPARQLTGADALTIWQKIDGKWVPREATLSQIAQALADILAADDPPSDPPITG